DRTGLMQADAAARRVPLATIEAEQGAPGRARALPGGGVGGQQGGKAWRWGQKQAAGPAPAPPPAPAPGPPPPCPPPPPGAGREQQAAVPVDVVVPAFRNELILLDAKDERLARALQRHGDLLALGRPDAVLRRRALLAEVDGLERRPATGLEPERHHAGVAAGTGRPRLVDARHAA